MELLHGWKKRISRGNTVEGEQAHTYSLPKAPHYYVKQRTFITSGQDAKDMVEFARQRPLSHVGWDMEYQYGRPGVSIKKNEIAYDPRSIRPLILSLALAEARGKDDGDLYSFVIDLRNPELYPSLTELLRIPLCFVGHFVKGDLFCLLQLNLPEPEQLFDTWVCEKSLTLGRTHKRYKRPVGADDMDEIRAGEAIKAEEDFSLSLVPTCHRYGIAYEMAGRKEGLQLSFLDHPEDAPFTAEQLRYAAEDAIAVARLYPLQVAAITQAGILSHLITVEMPWVKTNAHIEWRGVKIAPDKRHKVLQACAKHLSKVERQLSVYGISSARSHPQLQEFFDAAGLLDLFRQKGGYSFEQDQLQRFSEKHPVIPLILRARRLSALQSDKILSTDLIGADGRIHPQHGQLGTHTGRQTSKWPNILGLNHRLRPLIVAAPGRAIGDVDLSQIEVGIAAAVYHDEKLIEMFNAGDVYTVIAQYFYRNELSDKDQQLSAKEFKHKHPKLRSQMKTCTLGIIYGLTAYGIAHRLNVNIADATRLLTRFMEMFPSLQQAQAHLVESDAIRGYATTHTGLRRYRAKRASLSNWEHNWLMNFPVQASAATVFKVAGNRLDKLYRQYDAWLIIPLHDAFVFEVPRQYLKKVAALTDRTMREAVQEHFPELQPRTEVNLSHPECWNKEGKADAFTSWLAKPYY